jgi:hypothetical protein
MTTHILHRQIAAPLPVAVGGRGVELFDAEGPAPTSMLRAGRRCPAWGTATPP